MFWLPAGAPVAVIIGGPCTATFPLETVGADLAGYTAYGLVGFVTMGALGVAEAVPLVVPAFTWLALAVVRGLVMVAMVFLYYPISFTVVPGESAMVPTYGVFMLLLVSTGLPGRNCLVAGMWESSLDPGELGVAALA